MQIEMLVGLASIIVTIVSSLAVFAYWLGRKFEAIDARFREIDARFQEIDKRFQEIGRRFDSIDERFKSIDERFKQIDKRFKQVDERFKRIDGWFKQLDSKLERFMKVMFSYVESAYTTLVDFMGLKGLFTESERRYLLSEFEKLSKVHATMLNPLKPEEAKFILEVVKELKEKPPEEIDLSKLDKVIEIARRWLWEDGHPDAARMLFIAHMLRSIIAAEKLKAEEKRKKKRA